MKWYQRPLVPIVYWVKQLWGRIRPTPVTVKFPAEMLPLLQLGTIAMKYCEYIERSPENLTLSRKLDLVIKQQADQDTMIHVRKVLSAENTIEATFDWLVHLGDAKEYDREGFKAYLLLPPKTRN